MIWNMYKLCKNKKSKIPNKYGILFVILRSKSHQKRSLTAELKAASRLHLPIISLIFQELLSKWG